MYDFATAPANIGTEEEFSRHSGGRHSLKGKNNSGRGGHEKSDETGRQQQYKGSKAASSLTFARSFCEPLDDDASVGETIEEKVFHFISSTREEAKMNSKARKYIFATQDKGKITLFITLNSQYCCLPPSPLFYLFSCMFCFWQN